jgi:hypothetical protein
VAASQRWETVGRKPGEAEADVSVSGSSPRSIPYQRMPDAEMNTAGRAFTHSSARAAVVSILLLNRTLL